MLTHYNGSDRRLEADFGAIDREGSVLREQAASEPGPVGFTRADLRNHVRALEAEVAYYRGLDFAAADRDARLAGREQERAVNRSRFISVGCSYDGAVALIGVCHDVADSLARDGDVDLDDYRGDIVEWLQDNGYGVEEYTVTYTGSLVVEARSEDDARDAAADIVESSGVDAFYNVDISVEL